MDTTSVVPKPPVEVLCARCEHEIDEDGYCSTCGATTILGKLVVATAAT